MSAIQNGLLRVLSNEQLMAADAAAQAAEARQNEPVILNLATYVRKCFDAADRAKSLHEADMLNALRMRNGEYAPDQLAEIRKTGGSEIYMRVGATKMRAAQSWLKDIFLTMSRPFTVVPTPEPDVPSDQLSNVDALVQQVIAQGVMQGAPPPMAEEIDALREGTVKQIRLELDKVAKERAERAEQRIDDVSITTSSAAPAPVPTLGEWGVIFLATLLAGLAAGAFRRPRSTGNGPSHRA